MESRETLQCLRSSSTPISWFTVSISLTQKNKKKCRELIKTLTGDLRGVISTQVMQEFYVASTTKLGADVLTVKDILHSFERFETIIITHQIIKEAIDCSIINKLSFWDALIVIAAESAKCEKLWSEDLAECHGTQHPHRLSEKNIPKPPPHGSLGRSGRYLGRRLDGRSYRATGGLGT